ncbi:MAG: hypothetical protein PSN46_09400 [Gammaproteobacteria bacterium]|nr:hypothetical protein [Gammaproteobacteria bacterium]
MIASEILQDHTASDWLKQAINTALYRDPVDAANDAEILLSFLSDRADKALAELLKEIPK